MWLYDRVSAETQAGSDETARATLLQEHKTRILAQIAAQALEAVNLVRSVHHVSTPLPSSSRSTGEVVLLRDDGGKPKLTGNTTVCYYHYDYSVDRDRGTPVLDKPTVYASVATMSDLNPGDTYPDYPRERGRLLDGTAVITDYHRGYNTEQRTLNSLDDCDAVVLPEAPNGVIFFNYYDAMSGLITSITDAALNPDLNPRQQ